MGYVDDDDDDEDDLLKCYYKIPSVFWSSKLNLFILKCVLTIFILITVFFSAVVVYGF
jgi:hypothetical protein